MVNSETRLIESYRRLIDITGDLASTLDLDSLLHHILRAATQLVSADEASILLFDAVQNSLFFQASTDSQNAKVLSNITVPVESIAGWVARNRQSVIVPDVSKDERWFRSMGQQLNLPNHSMIAVPLIARGQLTGVLEVINRTHTDFSEEDRIALEAMAVHAALAIQNARLFEQSDLISELVHELRTPLSSITALSHLLQRDDLTTEQMIAFAHTIQQETTRLQEMTTRFLDTARLESGRVVLNRVPLNIGEILNECCLLSRLAAHAQGMQIKLTCQHNLPMVNVDRERLKQVINNLLSNAIKYNRPGGSIDVRADLDAAWVRVEVEDGGEGIPEDAIPHLFEKFYRVKSKEQTRTGTGLGLYICKKIVEAHGGNITVCSQLGTGSVFTLRLPVNDGA